MTPAWENFINPDSIGMLKFDFSLCKIWINSSQILSWELEIEDVMTSKNSSIEKPVSGSLSIKKAIALAITTAPAEAAGWEWVIKLDLIAVVFNAFIFCYIAGIRIYFKRTT